MGGFCLWEHLSQDEPGPELSGICRNGISDGRWVGPGASWGPVGTLEGAKQSGLISAQISVCEKKKVC